MTMPTYEFQFTALEEESFQFDSRAEAIQAARDWVKANAPAWDSSSGLLTVEEEIEEDGHQERAVILREYYVRDRSGAVRNR